MTTPNNPSNPKHREMAEDVKAKADKTAQEVKTKAQEQLEQQESRATDTMDKVADATQAAARQLAERNETTLSQYVSDISDGISKLSNNLRHKNTDELIRDASRLARENTGLFLLGSVAVGFGLSRLAKANRSPSDSESQREGYGQQQDSRDYAAGARDYTAGAQDSAAGAQAYDTGSSGAAEPSPASHASTSYLPEERETMQDPTSRSDSGSSTTTPGKSTGA